MSRTRNQDKQRAIDEVKRAYEAFADRSQDKHSTRDTLRNLMRERGIESFRDEGVTRERIYDVADALDDLAPLEEASTPLDPCRPSCAFRTDGELCGETSIDTITLEVPALGPVRIALCSDHIGASDQFLDILARWPVPLSETEPLERGDIKVGLVLVNKMTNRKEVIQHGRWREVRLESSDGYHHVVRIKDLLKLYTRFVGTNLQTNPKTNQLK